MSLTNLNVSFVLFLSLPSSDVLKRHSLTHTHAHSILFIHSDSKNSFVYTFYDCFFLSISRCLASSAFHKMSPNELHMYLQIGCCMRVRKCLPKNEQVSDLIIIFFLFRFIIILSKSRLFTLQNWNAFELSHCCCVDAAIIILYLNK